MRQKTIFKGANLPPSQQSSEEFLGFNGQGNGRFSRQSSIAHGKRTLCILKRHIVQVRLKNLKLRKLVFRI
ncbi:hypothetical protein QQP08_002099 [Theobroma cacao]|nr:hypothetical protein QQP08_002099 [Theobroma cacao]